MAARDHHHFYDTTRWQHLRKMQLVEHPLCKICLERGIVTPAKIVDHIAPHKGSWLLFCTGPLQSLCEICHNGAKKFEENRGFSREIDITGWPVDRRHPCYKK